MDFKNNAQLYENLFNNCPSYFLLIDQATHNIVEVNKSACKFYGYDRENFILMNFSEIIVSQLYGHDRQSVFNFSDDSQIKFHTKNKLANGLICDVEILASLFNYNGQSLLFLIISDIGNQKQFSDHQNEVEHSLQSISENFTNGMFYQLIVKKDGIKKFSYLSNSVHKLYGVTPEDGIKIPDLIFGRIIKDDRDLFEKNLREASLNFTDFMCEVRLIDPTGLIRWSHFVSKPRLLLDGSTCWDGVEFITSDRKKAEEALRLSEERFRIILDVTQIGIWDWNLETDEWFASPIYFTMLGYEPEYEFSDRNKWLAKIHPDDLNMVHEKIKSVLTQKTSNYIYEARIKDANDCYCWVQVIGHVVEYNSGGKALRMVGIRKNINEQKISQENLKKNEILLRSLINTIPDLIFIKNPNGTYLQCNNRFETLYGKTEKEIIGKTDFDFVNSDLAKFFQKKDKEAMDAGRPTMNEELLTFYDGHQEVLETIKTPIYIDNNDLLGVLGISRNISERKDIELKLRENKRFLETLISNLPGMVYRCKNDPEWTMNFVSEGCIALTGYLPEQILFSKDVSYGAIIFHEDRQIVWDSVQTGIAAKKTFRIEYRIITKQGEKKWVYEQGVGIFSDPGKLIGLEGVIIDVTERKNAEERAKRSNERVKESLDNLMEGCQIISFDWTYLYLNNAAAMQGRKSKEDYLGQTMMALYPGIEHTMLFTVLKLVMYERRAESLENEFIYENGSKAWFSLSIQPVDEGIFILSIDITDRKLADFIINQKNKEIEAQNEEYRQINEELCYAKEKAEESDQLKTAFLQNMSHEIRTPMNAIMGFSEILIDQYNNKAKLEKFAKIINRRSADLLKIINDILDISKIESGQLQVNNEEFDLNELFLELSVFFNERQIRIEKKHIQLIFHKVNAPMVPVIITDKTKLNQIFINLIDNALKFTDEGKIEVGCKFGENAKLYFYVSDTGIGVPDDKKEFIFNRFSQLDQGDEKVPKGTGLGLSIVKGLVILLGGQIFMKSEPGKGSTFTFTIDY